MARTNVHIHLFSADHVPDVQLYYLIRGAIHSAAREHLETITGIPTTEENLEKLDSSLDRFEWPWPPLFTALDVTGGFGVVPTLVDVPKLTTMFETVSRAPRSSIKGILGKNQREFLRALRDRTDYYKARNHPFPFQRALCEIVTRLYDAHRQHSVNNPVTQRELWDRFLASPGAKTFDRVVALSVNFDEAFGHGSPPDIEVMPRLMFKEQATELGQLAEQVNQTGAVRLLPFLGVEPRGYDGASLRQLVEDRVGRDKLFKGLKVYPPMGVLPNDPALQSTFDYCQDHGIPVLSHCSLGGAGVRGRPRNFAEMAHPDHWKPVLSRLEARASAGTFRLCLAHFSSLEWPDDMSWADEVIDLMTRYPGNQGVEVFSDIAFDVIKGATSRARYEQNVQRVQRLGLERKVMFGSDWWNYLYECDDEAEFLGGLKIDSGWWHSHVMEQAADSFLQDVVQ